MTTKQTSAGATWTELPGSGAAPNVAIASLISDGTPNGYYIGNAHGAPPGARLLFDGVGYTKHDGEDNPGDVAEMKIMELGPDSNKYITYL